MNGPNRARINGWAQKGPNKWTGPTGPKWIPVSVMESFYGIRIGIFIVIIMLFLLKPDFRQIPAKLIRLPSNELVCSFQKFNEDHCNISRQGSEPKSLQTHTTLLEFVISCKIRDLFFLGNSKIPEQRLIDWDVLSKRPIDVKYQGRTIQNQHCIW